MSYVIYVVEHRESGKKYVGFTKDLEQRWQEHIASSRRKRCRGHLHRAIALYGSDAFNVCAIETFSDRESALKSEIRWIEQLSTFGAPGYNMTRGGDGCRIEHHSIETRHKMSESHIGKRLSDETKLKISSAGKGRKHSDESRRLMSQKKSGIELTPEHKQRLKDAWVLRRAKGLSLGGRKKKHGQEEATAEELQRGGDDAR